MYHILMDIFIGVIKEEIKTRWSIYSNSFNNVVIPLEKTDKDNGCLYLSSKRDLKKLGNNWSEVTKKLDKFTPNIKKFLKRFKFFQQNHG